MAPRQAKSALLSILSKPSEMGEHLQDKLKAIICDLTSAHPSGPIYHHVPTQVLCSMHTPQYAFQDRPNELRFVSLQMKFSLTGTALQCHSPGKQHVILQVAAQTSFSLYLNQLPHCSSFPRPTKAIITHFLIRVYI